MKRLKAIHLIHVLVLAPFLIYLGIVQNRAPKWVFWVLLALASTSALYHLYHLSMHHTNQVNIFHLVAVLPLLIYVGLQQQKTPQFAFLMILAVGITALWYHGMQLIS